MAGNRSVAFVAGLAFSLGVGLVGCGGGGGGGPRPPGGTARIAFVSDRDGNLEIYSMRPDGSDVRRLTNHAEADHSPSWSPDHSRIAFFSDRDGDLGEVYVMNADGSGLVNLTQNPASIDGGPAWSPDGSQIAYVVGGDEIAVRAADGSGGPTVLTNHPGIDGGPVWSPDGSQIYFVSNRDMSDGTFRLYVMNRDGSSQTPVGSFSVDGRVAVSPDGQRLLYASLIAESTPGLFLANRDGSGAARVGPDNSAEPAWATNGQTISFTSWKDGNGEIYSISASGTNLKRLTKTPFLDGSAVR